MREGERRERERESLSLFTRAETRYGAAVMRTLKLLLLGLALLALLAPVASCGRDVERQCRIAVRSLVAAPKNRVAGELDKVVAFGRYALPDIEQEFHSSSTAPRGRLLDALSRLNLRESIPFVELAARWEKDATVRSQAEAVLRKLRASGR